MYKDVVGYYIDNYNTLLPADSAVPELVTELWYQYIKTRFDNTCWSDFYEREIFECRKFKSDDDSTNYANLVKTIKIRLQNKNRIYNRMFNAFMADYNPLWNVDGVTGRITESSHTGTDTDVHTGSDTVDMDGTETRAKTGTDTLTYDGEERLDYAGVERTDYSGSEETEYSGSETNTQGGSIQHEQSKTTFDSSTYNPTEKNVDTYQQKTDTRDFTNRADTLSYDDRYDEKSFTDRRDTKSFYSRSDETEYNTSDELTHDTTQETTYDSTLTKTLNLKDTDLEMIIRQGNIGVTKSSELLLDTLKLYDDQLMDFVKYVVNDCINQISYSVY